MHDLDQHGGCGSSMCAKVREVVSSGQGILKKRSVQNIHAIFSIEENKRVAARCYFPQDSLFLLQKTHKSNGVSEKAISFIGFIIMGEAH